VLPAHLTNQVHRFWIPSEPRGADIQRVCNELADDTRHAVERGKNRGMANPTKVAEKDGAHKTNRVTVERVDFLADGYKIEALDGEEIGATAQFKVLRVCPTDPQSTAPRFLGRWDDAPPKPWDEGRAQRLDFDLVDRNDRRVHKRKLPYGHGTKSIETTDGHRQYQVKIGLDEKHIVFEGVVEFAIGFRMHCKAGAIAVVRFQAELIHGAGIGPDSAERGGLP
jgi:hypothetical protein